MSGEALLFYYMELGHPKESEGISIHTKEINNFGQFLSALKNEVQMNLMKQQASYRHAKGIENQNSWVMDVWVKEGYSEKFEEAFRAYLDNPPERKERLLAAFEESKDKLELLAELVGYFRDYFVTHQFGKEGIKPNPNIKPRVGKVLADTDIENGQTLH